MYYILVHLQKVPTRSGFHLGPENCLSVSSTTGWFDFTALIENGCFCSATLMR